MLNPVFADLGAEGYTIVIAAICTGIATIITSVLTLILGYLREVRQERREEAKIERDLEAALKVEEVRVQASIAAQKADDSRIATVRAAAKIEAAAARHEEKLDSVVIGTETARSASETMAKKIEVVHKATNSLASALADAKLAQGIAEGTAAGLAQGREENKDKPSP